jgi:hypothetical protein
MAQKLTAEEIGELHSFLMQGSSGMPSATASYLGRFYGIGTSNVRPGYINQKGNFETIVTNVGGTMAQIQHGWDYITAGAAASYYTKSKTFPTAFLTTPIVLITPGGDQIGGTPTLGSGGNNRHGLQMAKAYGVTASGFNALVGTSAGNYSIGDHVHFHWLAIGLI